MKLMIKTTAVAAAVALAACTAGDDTAAENVEDAAEAQAENLEAAADNATTEGAADSLEAQAENVEDAGEEKADEIDDTDNAAAGNVSGM